MTTLPRPAARPRTTPQAKRWTCAEFHRLGDLGVFEGTRAMLIDGVILEEGPMNPPHAITVEKILRLLFSIFGPEWRIRCQLPLVLGQHLDPEPDLAVIAHSTPSFTAHPTMAELVIEIADTSLDYDTDDKRQIYARAGIREYWVVDINGRQLLVYRDPLNGDYTSRLTFGPTDSVSPLALTSAVIRVADLLP